MEINKTSLINTLDHIVSLQCLMMLISRTCLKMLMVSIHMNLESITTRILEVACEVALKHKHNHSNNHSSHNNHHKMRKEVVWDKVSSIKCKVDLREDKLVASVLKSWLTWWINKCKLLQWKKSKIIEDLQMNHF